LGFLLKGDNKMNLSISADEIKKLSFPEKMRIIDQLWDSIMKNNEYPELTETQQTELNQRIDSYHANPQQGKTWDEIKHNFWQSK